MIVKKFISFIFAVAIVAMYFDTHSTSGIIRVPVEFPSGSFPVAKIISDDELLCLQRTIFFEARNQPQAGQAAVAFTVMNRVDAKGYPNSICEVAYQSTKVKGRRICQFSWYCDGKLEPNLARQEERKAWKRAETIADLVYMGKIDNPVENATMFHAVYVSPKWKNHFDKVAKIGDHIFYQVAVN